MEQIKRQEQKFEFSRLSIEVMQSKTELTTLKTHYNEFFENIEQFSDDPQFLDSLFVNIDFESKKHVEELQNELLANATKLENKNQENVGLFSESPGFFYLSEIAGQAIEDFRENSSNLSIYQDFYRKLDDSNKLNFKASSLFKNAIFFENESIKIITEYSLIRENGQQFVELKFTFIPKINELFLSFNLLNENAFFADDFLVTNFEFTKIIEMKILRDFRNIASAIYPAIHIELQNRNYLQKLDLWSSFTINKFVDIRQNTYEELLAFLENVI